MSATRQIEIATGRAWTKVDAGIAAALAAVATFLVYHRALQFPFALDDYTYLFQAAGLDPSPFELRRWLTTHAYYSLGLHLFGPRPFGWHVVALLLHVGNAVWVFLLARRLGLERTAAWIASTLFACSPVAFTTLYWVAGTQELASGFFLLGATYFALDTLARRYASLPLFALAVLCKESVLAAPLAIALRLGRRGLWLAGALLALGGALFVGAGLHQRMLDASPTSPYATAYDATLLVNLATQVVWFLAPWRTYPDRIASPDPSLVLWAVAAAGAAAIALIVRRGRGARELGQATVWFVALLLPVLPLRSHSYAYYLYLPQIGFLMCIAVGVQHMAERLAKPSRSVVARSRAHRSATSAAQRTGSAGSRNTAASARADAQTPGAARLAAPAVAARFRGLLSWHAIAGAIAVGFYAFFAAQNARTHETLTLPNSVIPHDSVVRYGRVAGDLVAQLRDAHLPSSVHRVVVFGIADRVAAPTPGNRPSLGGEHISIVPMRLAMYGDKLVRLHFPGLVGTYVDSLTPDLETPDTALFFGSGLGHLDRLADAADGYTTQAQGRLIMDDVPGAERALRRALQLKPDHSVARLVLAYLRIRAGELAEATALMQGLDPATIPSQLHPMLQDVQKSLAAFR